MDCNLYLYSTYNGIAEYLIIKIMKKLTPGSTINQIISRNEQAEILLKSIGINPQKYLSETLRAVCFKKKWSESELMHWLEKEMNSFDLTICSADDLANFDLNHFRITCLQKSQSANLARLNTVKDLFARVYKVHGIQYSWIKDLNEHFYGFEDKTRLYLTFGLQKLLPLVSKLLFGKTLLDGEYRQIEHSLEIVQRDHDLIKELIRKMNSVEKSFTGPRSGCSTMKIFNTETKQLFRDINKQFRIEREVLTPLAKLKLESY